MFVNDKCILLKIGKSNVIKSLIVNWSKGLKMLLGYMLLFINNSIILFSRLNKFIFIITYKLYY
jgi:hypothetical protein